MQKVENLNVCIEYAKMLFFDECKEKNINNAMEYFKLSKDKGFVKNDLYLRCLEKIDLNSFFSHSSEVENYRKV